MNTDVVRVVVLEVPMMALVEVDNDGQDFTETHTTRLIALRQSRSNSLRSPLWLKLLTKFIDEVK
jgi:hypothetical protein